MLGIVKEISGQKQIIPLTTDAGTGAPVGTLIQQYKKKPMSGYLYCDGSTFDQNAYPALYMYLGTNVLPDYRECVMVGAEQNTTDTIATHDVYGEGEFKDDQLQEHKHEYLIDEKDTQGTPAFYAGTNELVSFHTILSSGHNGRTGDTDTTHGKQKAVYVYIKATSGLAENQQDNVLNNVKDYVDNSNSYSTQEVKTGGTWIDGKPIYRKVIDFGSLPNATTKNVNTGLDFSICNVIKFEAFAKNTRTSDSTSAIPVPYGTDVLPSVMKDGTISIYTTKDWTNYSQCYVTIEYTKTTD